MQHDCPRNQIFDTRMHIIYSSKFTIRVTWLLTEMLYTRDVIYERTSACVQVRAGHDGDKDSQLVAN